MPYNYDKLRGKIKEVCGTEGTYATKLGVSRTSISHRLNGRLEFSQAEIDKSVDVLNLKAIDIPEYFFTKLV